MSRLKNTFQNLKKNKQTAFIPFITAGDPSMDISYDLIRKLDRLGADVIELGMPFSDPMADGPTIQKASERSLANGCDLKKIFALIKRVRKVSEVPLLLMGYYNPILQYGLDNFVKDATSAGADALLIVDLPVEESTELRKALKNSEIDLVFLLTPTSTPERVSLVQKHGSGFVYYVSMTGTTGSKNIQTNDVIKHLKKLKKSLTHPLCVGFGISTPADIKGLKAHCDGIVVGSALVKKLENPSRFKATNDFGKLAKQLSQATKL